MARLSVYREVRVMLDRTQGVGRGGKERIRTSPLDAWALPCVSSVERVQQCCTELFHAFLPDYVKAEVSSIQPDDTTSIVQGHCLWNRKSGEHFQTKSWMFRFLVQFLLPVRQNTFLEGYSAFKNRCRLPGCGQSVR